MAKLVVTAVRVEGRTKSAVARDYGVSRRWVHELVRRYDAEGERGLAPRSRRPRTSPTQIAVGLEDEIVEVRIRVGREPHAVVAGGFVWVANYADDTLTKVDPDTNEVVGQPIDVGGGPVHIAAARDALWVVAFDQRMLVRVPLPT